MLENNLKFEWSIVKNEEKMCWMGVGTIVSCDFLGKIRGSPKEKNKDASSHPDDSGSWYVHARVRATHADVGRVISPESKAPASGVESFLTPSISSLRYYSSRFSVQNQLTSSSQIQISSKHSSDNKFHPLILFTYK